MNAMRRHHMSRGSFLGVLTILVWMHGHSASAQTFSTRGYFNSLISQPAVQTSIPGPEGLRGYVVEGKLRLTLDDAIRLTLMNNTDVRINELQVETAKFSVERAYSPFDPLATSSFTTSRSNSPSFTQLAGASTLSSLNQQTQFGYSQTFETGTNFQVGLSTSKS